MKIYFKSIEIKNFLSVGNVPFILNFTTGLHAIMGKVIGQTTSNGVGKSTICEAIVWALYGKTLRELNNDKIVNSVNEHECEVRLTFSINNKDYAIERGLKPGYVRLIDLSVAKKKDHQDEERSSKREDQQVIQNLIGISFTTFKYIIAVNINYSIPFFKMPIASKRSLFEDINNLCIYGKMLDISRKDYNESRSLLKISSAELKLIRENYNQQVSMFESYADMIKKWHIDHEAAKASILKQIETTKKAIEEKAEQICDIDYSEKHAKLEEMKDKILEAIAKYKAKFDLGQTEVQSIPQKIRTLLDNPICPSCNSPTDGDHAKKHLSDLEARKEELLTQNKEIAQKILGFKEKQKEVQEKLNKISNTISLQREFKKDLSRLEERLESLNDSFNKENVKTASFKQTITQEMIDKAKVILDEKIAEVAASENSLKYNDFLKDVFGDNGIKTWVIKKIIPVINKKMNEYLSHFGANYKISFNHDLEEVFKTKRGEEFGYSNFSSGEQKRIDLAFMFSIISIAKSQSSVDCNILFLDEVCDSSMCSDGIYSLMTFLKSDFKTMDPELATYVITHKKEISEDNFNTIVHLKKEGGFTKLDQIQECKQVIQT